MRESFQSLKSYLILSYSTTIGVSQVEINVLTLNKKKIINLFATYFSFVKWFKFDVLVLGTDNLIRELYKFDSFNSYKVKVVKEVLLLEMLSIEKFKLQFCKHF